MASGQSQNTTPPFNLFLTPQQQGLLLAALNSNADPSTMRSLTGMPAAPAPHGSPSDPLAQADFPGSPLFDDYDYDPKNDDFDYSTILDEQYNALDGVPGLSPNQSDPGEGEGESHEKRSHPDDDDDEQDGSAGRGSAKRRESGNAKVPKKPGRKPLMTEPTTKRKAQNRAAQRAFRERKEKHVKDLEIKVDELQKASNAANNENTALRAQVDRMTTELHEYKLKLSIVNNARPSSLRDKGMASGWFGGQVPGHPHDINFQFEFPKFGVLPGPPMDQNAAAAKVPSANGLSWMSPQAFPASDAPLFRQAKAATSRSSFDSSPYSLAGANTSSPSASSNSNPTPSSCGTSPEPFTQSPMGFKPVDNLVSAEKAPQETNTTPALDSMPLVNFDTSFDWLAQQNGNFDPQLFGDWREPQGSLFGPTGLGDNVLGNEHIDFPTPYNTALASSIAPTNPPATSTKKNLIDEIDARNDADDEVPPAPEKEKPGVPCPKIWDKIQHCEKVQNGEIDIDNLCKELAQKAKCTGNGPEVGHNDFQSIMEKYVGSCPDKTSTVSAANGASARA